MWPRPKNSPHTYAHEGLESIFLFEFIELQWVQTDFLRLSDNNSLEQNNSGKAMICICGNKSRRPTWFDYESKLLTTVISGGKR